MNIIIIIASGFLSILSLLSLTIYWLINIWVSIIITIFIIYKLAYLIIGCVVYLGSFKLYLRLIQNQRAEQLTNFTQSILRSFIHILLQKKIYPSQKRSFQNIVEYLKCQTLIFQDMKNLSDAQRQYKINLLNLDQLLHDKINQSSSIDILLSSNSLEEIQANTLIQQINTIISILDDQVSSIDYISSLKKWLFFNLRGSLTEYRIEFQLSNIVQRTTLNIGKCQIDCQLILNSQENDGIVLFNNPNGGYYEYMFRDSSWFEFYKVHKINVIVWNYPGYGESTGPCNPDTLNECAIYLVNYFKRYNPKFFGTHGISLGGSVASYVAQQMNLDFLIVDRTYASLGLVAQYSMKPIARIALNLLTNWDRQNYLDFWNYQGPKLLIQDPRDEILPYESQMASQLSKQLFLRNTKIQSFYQNVKSSETQEYKEFFYKRILSKEKYIKLCDIINRLCIQLKQNQEQFQDNEEIQIEEDELNSETTRVTKETYNSFGLLMIFEEALLKLRYKRVNLLELVINDENMLNDRILLFFTMCITYGGIEFQQSFTIFQSLLQQLTINEDIRIEQQLGIDIENMKQYICEIVKNLSNAQEQLIEMSTNPQKQTGELMTIKTGHNSNLSQEEFLIVSDWFMKKQLVI